MYMLANSHAVLPLAKRFKAVGTYAVIIAVTFEVPLNSAGCGAMVNFAHITGEVAAGKGVQSVSLIVTAI